MNGISIISLYVLVFPIGIKTKPISVIDDFESGVFIKDIWDNLEFIKNKIKWGSQVQGSFRRLSEHDCLVIMDAIQNKCI